MNRVLYVARGWATSLPLALGLLFLASACNSSPSTVECNTLAYDLSQAADAFPQLCSSDADCEEESRSISRNGKACSIFCCGAIVAHPSAAACGFFGQRSERYHRLRRLYYIGVRRGETTGAGVPGSNSQVRFWCLHKRLLKDSPDGARICNARAVCSRWPSGYAQPRLASSQKQPEIMTLMSGVGPDSIAGGRLWASIEPARRSKTPVKHLTQR